MVQPKRQRRKDERPAEIIEAAMDLFADKGYAATKLDDVARRAGVAKGTLYLYFETKDDLFHAVAQKVVETHITKLEEAARHVQGDFLDKIPQLLQHIAARLGDRRLPALARMVISESRTFPDLAETWRKTIVLRALDLFASFVSREQKAGRVRAGDPKLYALSVMGPLFLGLLYHEVFAGMRGYKPDLKKLAEQHAQTLLFGLAAPADSKHTSKRTKR